MSTSATSAQKPATQAEARSALHLQMEELIAAVGTVSTVQMDQPVACNPPDDSAGYAWTYSVVLTPNPGAAESLASSVAPAMRAKGYRVEQSPRTDEIDWYFRKDAYDLNVTLFPARGSATAGGSAPCLPKEA